MVRFPKVCSMTYLLASFSYSSLIARSPSSIRRLTSVRRYSQLKDYLVEFRCIHDGFRLLEFQDCAQCCGYSAKIKFQPVIMDPLYHEPIAVYVQLSDDHIAQQIALRSASIRNVVEVWADQDDLSKLVSQATTQYFKLHQHHFRNLLKSQNTWRVNFQIYGRAGYSGLDHQEKVNFLKNFNEIFIDINGTVHLKSPTTKFIYLEDWTDYQSFSNDYYKSNLTATSPNDAQIAKEKLESFQPKRRIFGRLVAKGPRIASTYDVRFRPYIGTTTMEATISHISANTGITSIADSPILTLV